MTKKTHRGDAGFSLAAIVMFATITSIFIAAAIPAYQTQMKREQEAELIFRGGEYTRAIQKYQRKLGVYPTSVDQLLSTNGLRFLRHAYKDPITGKDFRLITLNPDGSLNGSTILQQNMNNQPLFGNTSTGTQIGQQPFQSQTQNPQQPGGGFGTGFGTGNSSSTTTPGFSAPAGQQQGFGQQSAQQPGQSTNTQPGQGLQGANTLSQTTGVSRGIVGVASDSDKPSLKIYNNRQKYREWEFVAILGQQGQLNPQQLNPQGGVPANGQTSTNPFQTSSQTPGQAPNPITGQSSGQTPTSSAFGPLGGSSFGTGQQPK
ncbi:MAG TPA: hypothetical protein VGK48_02995 [Terriglobia bacterium]|jgi:hypothetical protein